MLSGDGHLYTYSGSAWVDNGAAGGGGGGLRGTAVIDFGSTPTNEATFVISDAGFVGQAHAEAFVMANATGDNDAGAHREAGMLFRLTCDPPGTGTMGLHVTVLAGLVTGTFNIHYSVA